MKATSALSCVVAFIGCVPMANARTAISPEVVARIERLVANVREIDSPDAWQIIPPGWHDKRPTRPVDVTLYDRFYYPDHDADGAGIGSPICLSADPTPTPTLLADCY